MSRVKVVMPQMGESITNGTITKWHKAPGDEIEVDEILLEISTDKVESEIPSPCKGRVEVLHGEEGDTIDVGVLIAEIEDDLSVEFSGESNNDSSSEKPSSNDSAQLEEKEPAKKEKAVDQDGERRFYTPLVKKMAEENGVSLSELSNIDGSGAGGRVNKSDLENYINNKGQAKTSEPVRESSQPSKAPQKVETPPAYKEGERIEIIEMDNMRKAIAKNMVASKMTSPHVNSVSEVDLSHLVKFREAIKNDFYKEEGFKITYTPFICYAIVQALREFPLVNSSIDGEKIIQKKDINLGCAVAVPGNGLVVPNIKNADHLNLLGIARAIDTLAKKARAKKLTMDELTGGTFTFTNVGSFGTLLATPIILQPQVGIYASGVIQKRVVVLKDDAIGVRSMMYGTHTYDHRLVDGELGGLFLESIHRHLREMQPDQLL